MVAQLKSHNNRITTPTRMIEEINQKADEGMGIIPLIGSGLSAASGIPAGIDYRAYLFYCLARVFGTNGESSRRIDQWDPRTLRWPDVSEIPLYQNVRDAMQRWAQTQLEQVALSTLSYYDARWQAAGAVADWRAMLHLLSRLTLQKRVGGREYEVIQTYPDQRIIDSFFIHLINNRSPNSAYLLLVHLADILRIKIILTTNFDNLIESAFQTFQMGVAVYDVHMDAHLPDADFVRAQRSIIKIHGGRYGLRADFTLDKYPTNDDVQRFNAYLSMYDKNYTHIAQNQRNLLVMGVSGNERRTIALICHALRNLQQLQVFWICHRNSEVNGIVESFYKTLQFLCIQGEIKQEEIGDCLDRLHITASPSPALFLLELYQKIFLSLPPTGIRFPVVWPIPPQIPGRVDPEGKKVIDYIQKEINNGEGGERIYRLDTLAAPLLPATSLFEKLSDNFHCIWMDLFIFPDPDDLAFMVIEAIARELGIMNLSPISIQAGPRGRWLPQEFRTYVHFLVRKSIRRLIIFVDCTEIANAGQIRQVRNCLRSLHDEHITYILVEQPVGRAATLRTAHRRSSLTNNWMRILSPSRKMRESIRQEYNAKAFMAKKIRNLPKLDIRRFVLTLTLFRYPCYLSVLNTWACIKAPESLTSEFDNDILRSIEAQHFVKVLLESDLLRESVGQFMYISREDREFIRQIIKKYLKQHRIDASFIEAECHQGIADWYMKLYRASGDIRAVFECLYHRFECFRKAEQVVDQDEKFRLQKTSFIEGEQAVHIIDEDISTLYHSFALGHLFATIIFQLSGLAKGSPPGWFKWKNNLLQYQLNRIRENYRQQIGHRKPSEKHPPLGIIEPVTDPSLLDVNIMNVFQSQSTAFIDKLHKGKIIQPNENTITKELLFRLYERIGQYIHDRDYKMAGFLTQAILHYFEFQIAIPNNWKRAETTRELRKQVRRWVEGVQQNVEDILTQQTNIYSNGDGTKQELALHICQDYFKIMVRILRRKHSLEFHQAQVRKYYRASPDIVNSYLRRAEITYIFSTEIERYIFDPIFLNRENGYLRTSTGLIMAMMNRHHEAYRRYNEAYGYLNFIPQVMQSEYVGIDLNRGETFLHLLSQCTSTGRRTVSHLGSRFLHNYQIRRLGFLFDAVASVELAETRLRGITVNNWLYSRICEMQLLICLETVKLRKEISHSLNKPKVAIQGEKYDLFSRCRECEVCGTRFSNNLSSGLEMSGDDIIRLSRFMEISLLFQKALDSEKKHRHHHNQLSKRFQTAMRQGKHRLLVMNRKPPCKAVGRYSNMILQRLQKVKIKDLGF
jgi:hypothetical protein